MKSKIYQDIIEKKKQGKKSFAVLIDPDKVDVQKIEELVNLSVQAKVDYFFVGGSLVTSNHLDAIIGHIKKLCSIPVVLFPGHPSQVSNYADGLLYLSLISGRNPDLLIGQHVLSAYRVKTSGLEIISTGYLVIDGGVPTSVSYISNTSPIPANKTDIAVSTAIAGEMLGLKLIYMDAGSGAQSAIPETMIQKVAENVEVPVIVGGGITTPEKALANCRAGADIIVVGNAIEKDGTLIEKISNAIHQYN
jgi:putative glycerol-1-phosphate prenyltransferase